MLYIKLEQTQDNVNITLLDENLEQIQEDYKLKHTDFFAFTLFQLLVEDKEFHQYIFNTMEKLLNELSKNETR